MMAPAKHKATGSRNRTEDAHAEGLPQLAFGDATAAIDSDIRTFSDRMSRVVTTLQHYASIGPVRDFRQKSATISINGLGISAGVCTPVQIEVAANSDLTLMVPLAGTCTSLVDRRPLQWQAGQSGLFLPNVGRGGFCDTRSVVMFSIQPDRLQEVARAMLGLQPGESIDFQLHQERQVALRHDGVDFTAALTHLCGLIDAVGGQAALASALKLDDQFYRIIALMMYPGLLAKEVVRKASTDNAALNPVCEYISSRLGAPLSLSDMEQISGLSRRSLQYAFMKRYGCTPMQWVREQRLLLARNMLVHPGPGTSVTAVALQSGFVNVGAFSGAYQKRFGEYPSQTLKLHAS